MVCAKEVVIAAAKRPPVRFLQKGERWKGGGFSFPSHKKVRRKRLFSIKMAASTMIKLLVLLAVAVAASSALPDAKVAEGGRVNHRVLPAADSDTWNTLPSEKKSSSSELEKEDDDDEEYDDDDYLDDDEEGSGDDDYYYDDDDVDDDDDDWYDDVDDKATSDKKDKSAAVPPFNVHASGSSSSSRSGGGSSDDIHFDDKKKKDDDDLYEYDNEQYYEEDYNFEEDESDDIVVDDGVAGVPVAPTSDQDQAEGSTGFRLSYIYVMLASAVVSFALVLLFFLLCR